MAIFRCIPNNITDTKFVIYRYNGNIVASSAERYNREIGLIAIWVDDQRSSSSTALKFNAGQGPKQS